MYILIVDYFLIEGVVFSRSLKGFHETDKPTRKERQVFKFFLLIRTQRLGKGTSNTSQGASQQKKYDVLTWAHIHIV